MKIELDPLKIKISRLIELEETKSFKGIAQWFATESGVTLDELLAQDPSYEELLEAISAIRQTSLPKAKKGS